MTSPDSYEQLFVIGAPRSGTTYLSGLLEDTRFGTPIESHFITKYHDRLDRYGDLQQAANFARLIRDISRERPVMQWQLDLDADLIRAELQGRVSYAALVNHLCLKRRKSATVLAWGDKTPQYTHRIETLHKLFPNARYIYIVRDGRDVALSLLEKSWGPKNVYSCAKLWVQMNRPSELVNRLASAGQLLFVKYEQLLVDPEQHVDELYRFLDEKLSAERKAELCSVTINGNAFKWKSIMSRRQIRIFDAVAGPTLRRLGYETPEETPLLGVLETVPLRLHNALLRAHALFVLNVIDGFRIRFLGAQPFDQ